MFLVLFPLSSFSQALNGENAVDTVMADPGVQKLLEEIKQSKQEPSVEAKKEKGRYRVEILSGTTLKAVYYYYGGEKIEKGK